VNLHHEIELGLVIGKPPASTSKTGKKVAAYKNLPNKPATMDIVDSYLLTIDMTARNIQNEAKKKGLPWSICKGFDTFLPISQSIPKSKIPDPHNIDIWLSVNDKMKQEDNTNLFLFDIPRMLSDISKVFSLEEGDIVITGTPKGVGPVEPGDVVRGGIRVDGKELQEAAIEVGCEDDMEGDDSYVFKET
jgi:acylpyruvate hydrolase